jgi:hypothetical protein
MKKYIVIFSCFVFVKLFSQKTFVNNTTAYYNGNSEFKNAMNANPSVNEITLNPDFTYKMWMRPHSSCFTWKSFEGTWKKVGKEILFTDKYEIREPDVDMMYSNKNIDKYVLYFVTDKKVILKNIEININYEYDFDSNVKFDDTIKFITDTNGKIEIPFNRIPNRAELASLRFKVDFNGREVFDYLTENETVNKKTSEVPTSITIVIRENPQKETIIRTVKAIKKNNEIEIISTKKTSGKLTDYNDELKLEKKYTLEKS